ncbi:MAG: hypothetical protein ABEJ61_07340 [Haloferacaceae archaeon]
MRPRSPRSTLHVALAAAVLLAGCLGGGPAAPSGVDGTRPGLTTSGTVTGHAATGTPAVDCPADTDRLRRTALDHVASERGVPRDRVSVVASAVVDYPLLGECYYHAKVRAGSEVVDAFVAANGTVANRSRVEARAERAARERYGKRTPELDRALAAAGPDERVGVVLNLREVDRDALDVDATPGTTAYKRELERARAAAAERRTASTVERLRATEGVTVASVASLRVVVRATPAGVRRAESFRNVSRLARHRTDTPTVLPAG